MLRIIASNRDWTRSYAVKLALATNPKCPVPTAMKFVNYLQERDLRSIMKSKDVPSPIATHARRIAGEEGKAVMDESRAITEVNARIVYWGIAGAGKRTNLRVIHAKLRPDHRGELRELPTRLDPTVTYCMLPIELGEVSGVRTRIQVVTAPSGPEQAPTRKQLLDRVDGVVFVVDARRGSPLREPRVLRGAARGARRLRAHARARAARGPVQQARPDAIRTRSRSCTASSRCAASPPSRRSRATAARCCRRSPRSASA